MIPTQYQEARIHKDKNYDGVFYFAVKTTGIVCRPSCPSPVAKEDNVTYHKTLFEALAQGYRPCLRCQPDIHTDYQHIDGAELVEKALGRIYSGYLIDHDMEALASALYTTSRNLRHSFSEQLGIAPIKIAKYHKGLFAKNLLLNSTLSMTDIASASGFNSIRQFNDVFKDLFETTPSHLRKSQITHTTLPIQGIKIPYKNDFDFDQLIGFMKPRALEGIEVITDSSYSRSFRINGASGYFSVTNNAATHCLELMVHSEDVRVLMPIIASVKKMFDLSTDLNSIKSAFSSDALLQSGMVDGNPPRLPVAFNAFEFVIRAILGQVVSVSFATTLAKRLVERSSIETPESFPEGLSYFFPSPIELAPIDLTNMGMTKTKINTISLVIQALLNNQLSLETPQSIEAFHKDFIGIKGIGDWTVQYVAMRGLGIKDAFPYNDLGVIKALTKDGVKPTNKQIKERSKAWQPFRAYAALCLWSSLGNKEA